MSNVSLEWAWTIKLDSPITKLVLVALADHAHGGDNICWPSRRRLRRRTGLGLTALSEHIAKLESLGLIRKSPRYHKSGGRSTDVYQLIGPKLEKSEMADDLFDVDAVFGAGVAKPLKSPIQPPRGSMLKPAETLIQPPRGSMVAGAYNRHAVLPYNEEPERIDTSLRSVSIRRNPEEAFEEFKAVFPKTRWRDTAKVRKKFIRIASGKHRTLRATADEIVEGARRYAELIDPAFARMPSTWLNNGNWTAEENYGAPRPTPGRNAGLTENDQRRAIMRGLAGELDRDTVPPEGSDARRP